MKKFTFGTPEKLVPSVFCDGFAYTETDVKFRYRAGKGQRKQS